MKEHSPHRRLPLSSLAKRPLCGFPLAPFLESGLGRTTHPRRGAASGPASPEYSSLCSRLCQEARSIRNSSRIPNPKSQTALCHLDCEVGVARSGPRRRGGFPLFLVRGPAQTVTALPASVRSPAMSFIPPTSPTATLSVRPKCSRHVRQATSRTPWP